MNINPELFSSPAFSFETQKLPPNTEIINPEKGIQTNHANEFIGWTDEQVENFLTENRFIKTKKLSDGTWAGLYPLAYTLSVCCDIGKYTSYVYRWCFEDRNEAEAFLSELEDFDQVPTSRESLVGHRHPNSSRLLSTNELGIKKW